MSPKRNPSSAQCPFLILGLKEEEWNVSVDFTKSHLRAASANARGVVVEVENLRSGQKSRVFRECNTKRQCRELGNELILTALRKLL